MVLDGLQIIGQVVLGMLVLKVLLVGLGVGHLRLQQHTYTRSLQRTLLNCVHLHTHTHHITSHYSSHLIYVSIYIKLSILVIITARQSYTKH